MHRSVAGTSVLLLTVWSSVRFRIEFTLCLLMHQIHVGRCPSYLTALVSSSADNCRRPGLRSASSSCCCLKPRLRTEHGERAFSVCGPAEWNSLPSEFQMITDTTSLKKEI